MDKETCTDSNHCGWCLAANYRWAPLFMFQKNLFVEKIYTRKHWFVSDPFSLNSPSARRWYISSRHASPGGQELIYQSIYAKNMPVSKPIKSLILLRFSKFKKLWKEEDLLCPFLLPKCSFSFVNPPWYGTEGYRFRLWKKNLARSTRPCLENRAWEELSV